MHKFGASMDVYSFTLGISHSLNCNLGSSRKFRSKRNIDDSMMIGALVYSLGSYPVTERRTHDMHLRMRRTGARCGRYPSISSRITAARAQRQARAAILFKSQRAEEIPLPSSAATNSVRISALVIELRASILPGKPLQICRPMCCAARKKSSASATLTSVSAVWAALSIVHVIILSGGTVGRLRGVCFETATGAGDRAGEALAGQPALDLASRRQPASSTSAQVSKPRLLEQEHDVLGVDIADGAAVPNGQPPSPAGKMRREARTPASSLAVTLARPRPARIVKMAGDRQPDGPRCRSRAAHQPAGSLTRDRAVADRIGDDDLVGAHPRRAASAISTTRASDTAPEMVQPNACRDSRSEPDSCSLALIALRGDPREIQ